MTDDNNEYQPLENDWDSSPPPRTMKKEIDGQAMAIQPETRTSCEIGVGIDPDTKVEKTGVVPTGLPEGNTVDMATANLDERDIMLNESANSLLALLKNVQKVTGINVKSTYNLILEGRDLRNTMSKGKRGKLLSYIFVNKSESLINRGDQHFSQPKPKQDTVVDKVKNYFGNN